MTPIQNFTPEPETARPHRRIRRAAGWSAGVVLLALIGLWALLWFPPSANWLAARALSAPVAAGSLRAEVGSARLWRLGSLRLVDVRFIREDGSLLASVDSVVGTYRGTPLLRRRIIIPALRLVDPTVDVRKVDGVWEVASLAPSAGAEDSEIESQPSPWTIEMGRFAVHRGAAVVSSNGDERGRVEDLVLRGSDLVVGEDGSVSIDSLSFRATSPGAPGSLEAVLRGAIEDRTLRLDTLSLASPSSRASAKGSVPWPASDLFSMRRPPVIALDVDAPHVMLGDLGFLGANLNPAGAFSARATVDNPAPGQTEASARVTFGDGSRIEMIALLEEGAGAGPGETSSLSLTGTLDVEDLDPSYLVVDSPSGNVNASGTADIELVPRGDSLESTVVSGEVSAEVRPSTLAALAAEQGRLDLALGASEITIDYRGSLGSTVQDLRADVEAHGVLMRGSRPGYTGQARMVVGGLAPEPLTLLVEAEGRGFDPDSITGDLTVDLPQQTAFDRPLEARLTYSPETSSGPWSVELDHGGGSLDGEGRLGLGGHPMWTISRLVADSLDVGAWARDSLPSHLSGQADGRLQGIPGPTLNGTMELELTTWTLRGRLLPPTSGSIELDDGMVRLRAGTGGAGPRVSVNASATPFQTPPAVTIHRAEFGGLNPAAFSRDSTLTGSVNGSLSGGLQGNDLATASGHLELRLDSSRIAAQDITSGTGTFELSEGLLGGRVSLDYPGGEATVDAQALFSGAGWTDLEVSKATFRGVDLGRFTPGAELTTDLVGEMEGSLTRNPGGRPSGEASLRLAPSTVNAGEIESGSLAAQLTEGRIAAGGTFYVDGGGSVDLTVAAAVDSTRFSVERAQVDFHLPELGALLGAESPASLQGRVEVASSGSTDGGWTFHGSAWNGGWDNLSLDTMAISGRLGSNVVDVDTIVARGNAFSAHGGGLILLDATETEPPSFALTAELTDALPLAPLIDAEVLEVGTATAEIRLGRRADALVLEGHLDANAILVDELRIVGLAGDWFLAGAGANQIDTAHVTLDIGRIVGPSQGEVASTHADLHYDGDRVVLEVAAGLDETRDGELRAIVDPASRGRRFQVERFRFSVDRDVWTLEDTIEVDWTDGLKMGAARLIAGDQLIAFEGGIHPSEPDSFNLRTQGFRVGTVSDLVGFPEVEATVTSTLVLTGSLSEPEWSFEADGQLQQRGQHRGSVDMSLSYRADRLETDVTLRDRADQAVSLSGFIPVDLDFSDPTRLAREAPGDADLRVQADSFDIQWFAPFMDPELVSGLGGTVSADAVVRGRTSDPSLSGRVLISRGRISPVAFGTTYSSIHADLRLDGRTIRIAEASLTDGDGSAALTGSVALESLGLGRFDLAASLDEFLVISNSQSRARTSGEVRLQGTTDSPRVEGNVEVVSADVYLTGQGSATAGRDVEEVELTAEDLATLREVFGYTPPEDRTDVSALVSALSANLEIVVGRDSWLRQRMNPELAVQMSGELSVAKDAGDSPRVLGTISPVPGRSYVEQWGRRFQLESGQIVFRGPPLAPEVQLSATYAIPSRDNPGASEVVIRLDVEGRPDSLRLILGSTPDMDNADIVAYIATGRPAAQSLSGSGDTPNVTDVGVELAAGRLTSAIEGFAADAIGLDVVEIRREGSGDAVLVAGRYVSPRLYIGFQQPVSFGSDDGPARESTGQRAEIEYEAFRWLLLNLEGGRSDVEFFFRTRHGY